MRAAAALTTVGAAAASASAWWRGKAVRAVAPELRDPVLYLPQSLNNRFALRIARRRGAFPSAIDPRVALSEADAGGSGPPGEPAPPASRRPVRVLVYRPHDVTGPTGALLWVHGGGFVLGAADYDHEWCSTVAADLGVVVLSVDYRLAPEHPFPAALDDCFTALRWLHRQAGRLGVDPDRVAVGGASAGGGLAASLAQRAVDEGVPVAFQLLRYPMLDDRTVRHRPRGPRGRLAWTPRSNRFGWRSYLGRRPGGEALPPYAAPARRTDLSGLPPAWIGVGELDLFHDEGVVYAHRLENAGVACELLFVPGMYHGADGVRPEAESMRAFRASAVDALRRALTSHD